MFKTSHPRLSPPYSGWFSRRLDFADISIVRERRLKTIAVSIRIFFCTYSLLVSSRDIVQEKYLLFQEIFQVLLLMMHSTKQYFFESSLISSSCIFSSQYIFFTRRKSKLYLIMRKNFLPKFANIRFLFLSLSPSRKRICLWIKNSPTSSRWINKSRRELKSFLLEKFSTSVSTNVSILEMTKRVDWFSSA